MSSTFAKVVKAQRVDRKHPGRRGFTAQAILTLAHRKRTGTLKGPKKLTFWQRLRRWLGRVV